MYLYLDPTVVIYLSEDDAGDCSLNMWTWSDTERRAEIDPVVYKLFYDNYEFLYKKQLKKKKGKTKIQFLFWNTFVVLWRMYFIFFSFSLLQILLKKHLSDGRICLILTGATGFRISVLCCEILTLT